MARAFGRILSSIWDDPDFLDLDPQAQRMFLFLVSQKNLNHAGLLPLTIRRWAAKAKSLTPEQVGRSLADLAAGRFIVVDEDTEELLVRSFIRRDDVYKAPRVMGSAVSGALEISSKRLRFALLMEVDRLPVDELSDEPVKLRNGSDAPSIRAQVEGHINTLRKAFWEPTPPTSPGGSTPPPGGGSPTPSPTPSAGGSDAPAEPLPEGDAEGDRGTRARARAPHPLPLPLPHIENPSSASPDGESAPPRRRTPRPAIEAPEAWDRFWKTYPRKQAKGAAEKAWNKAIRAGADPTTIIDGALLYRMNSATTDAVYIKHPATWLNARCWEDEPDPQPQAPSAIGAPSVAAALQGAPIDAYRAEMQAHAAEAQAAPDPHAYDDIDGRTPLQRLGLA